MTLFDYYLQYMGEICAGKRKAPAIEHPAADIPAFVRACAAQDGETLPESVYEDFSMADAVSAAQALVGEQAVEEQPPQKDADVDKDKHPFEVLLDCVALDDLLKNGDKKGFYKLSKVTTGLDLDPEEFLFWLGNRELYASDEERDCAEVMDACLTRLAEEKELEVLAALLSGDQKTFELFRCEAPELVHLPLATFAWYSRNYLDRDYPIRFLMRRSGVPFPAKK